MQNKQLKFENPVRLAELNPTGTLQRIGLQDSHTLCDIGAGSGIFTLPAAQATKEKVYALELSAEMLSLIGDKAKAEGITNIELVKVEGETFDLADNTMDIALMVTVLHEIKNKEALLTEIRRILKMEGRLAIIEFHKRETPMGPALSHRMEKEELPDLLPSAGFREMESFDLGDNFYCGIYKKERFK
ncbi:MAG: methyltransferase domain-containing protein [Clostridia bacterium]|jgi:ubiquinone/menaquinone biosynthesis C-methylase UbiE|nr:methyltransferase domain-containing protein [Clostridia bacterium]